MRKRRFLICAVHDGLGALQRAGLRLSLPCSSAEVVVSFGVALDWTIEGIAAIAPLEERESLCSGGCSTGYRLLLQLHRDLVGGGGAALIRARRGRNLRRRLTLPVELLRKLLFCLALQLRRDLGLLVRG
jgi:hypothetical protein